jgi:hypothetical protein
MPEGSKSPRTAMTLQDPVVVKVANSVAVKVWVIKVLQQLVVGAQAPLKQHWFMGPMPST